MKGKEHDCVVIFFVFVMMLSVNVECRFATALENLLLLEAKYNLSITYVVLLLKLSY